MRANHTGFIQPGKKVSVKLPLQEMQKLVEVNKGKSEEFPFGGIVGEKSSVVYKMEDGKVQIRVEMLESTSQILPQRFKTLENYTLTRRVH